MTGYLTITEAAGRLGLSVSRVRRLCQQGRIRAEKAGAAWLIREADCHFEPRPEGRPGHTPAGIPCSACGAVAPVVGWRADGRALCGECM